jgi:hypothetical protein
MKKFKFHNEVELEGKENGAFEDDDVIMMMDIVIFISA